MSDLYSKENLLYFENNNINAKEYYRQKNEINKINERISKEPEVEESSPNENNSPQNSPSSFDDISYLENGENENEETASKKSFEFPIDGYDVFDYSKVIKNDESNYELSEKEEKNDSINKDSTLPTKPKKKQIKTIKKYKDEDEDKRNNNFHRNNNKTKNEKSSSCKKCIRERSRNKN